MDYVKVTCWIALVLAFNTAAIEGADYDLTFWTNFGPRVATNLNDKLELIINGTDGITGNHRCSTSYTYPHRDLHCAFSDNAEIGDVTCLTFVFLETYISVEFVKMKIEITKPGEELVTLYHLEFDPSYYGGGTFCYDKDLTAETFPKEPEWVPLMPKGYNPLDQELGFFYWMFPLFGILPFLVILAVAFGIIACFRANLCTCCKRNTNNGRFVPIYA